MRRKNWLFGSIVIIAAASIYCTHMGKENSDISGVAFAAELAFEETDPGFRYGIPVDPARVSKYYKHLSSELGDFFIYIYKYKEGFYAGADIGGQFYELTKVGHDTNPEWIDVSETLLFGVPSIRLRGYCGAACSFTEYITVDNGYPYVWLHVEAAVQEYDLDRDGKKDLITTVGTPLETHIYMMQDTTIMKASVNEALRSNSVSFFQDGRFIVYEPNSTLTRTYKYQDGLLVSK